MYACENQQIAEHINLLINNNANINSADNEGKTALMYALENYTEPDIAYFLIFAGANCSAEDKNGKGLKELNEKIKNKNSNADISIIEREIDTLGIRIDKYICVHDEGVREVIDALGGMPIVNFYNALERENVTGVNVNDSVDFANLTSAFVGGTGDFVNLFEPISKFFSFIMFSLFS